MAISTTSTSTTHPSPTSTKFKTRSNIFILLMLTGDSMKPGDATMAKIDHMTNYLLENYTEKQAAFLAAKIAPALNGYSLADMKRIARNIAIFNGWPYPAVEEPDGTMGTAGK